ncbi:MAG TPA: hypothetical protein VGB43_01705 [Flavobacterium sp.]
MKNVVLISMIVTSPGLKRFKGSESCAYVVITTTGADATWRSQYGHMIVQDDSDGVIVDLSLASDQAAWLLENGGKIDFMKSYPYISCVHEIPDPDEYVSQNQVYDTISLDSLKTEIAKKGGGTTFENDNYKYFIHLKEESSGITFTIEDEFVPDENYYSIPLFRAMLEIHKPNPEEFEVSMSTKVSDVIVVRVYGGAAYAYYDFSQNPFVPVSSPL